MAAADGGLESSVNPLQSFDSSLFDADNSVSRAPGSSAEKGNGGGGGDGGGGDEDGERRAEADGNSSEANGTSSADSSRMESARFSGARAAADPFEDGELKIIEDALECLRRRSSSETGRAEEDGAERADGVDEDGVKEDRVGKLLRKVQGVRSKSGKEEHAKSFGGDEARDEAKATEAALALLDRNSQAIERLSETFNRSRPSTSGDSGEGEDGEDANSSGSVEKADVPEFDGGGESEIYKKVVKQNKITHWVLGFMVVSSIVWRSGVLKFLMGLNDTISNPLQGVQDSFAEWTGFGGGKKGKDQDGPSVPVPPGTGDRGKNKDQKSLAVELEDRKQDFLKFGREVTERKDKDQKYLANELENRKDEFLKFGREVTGNGDGKKSH